MASDPLAFYRTLSRGFFPRSYSLKFLGIAFLGIHLPLIAFVVYLAASHGWEDALPAIIVVLLATLVGTALTMWSQHRLLAPIRRAHSDLVTYRETRQLPTSPGEFPDEAGQLMRETRESIESLDRLLKLKDQLAAGIAHDFRSPLTSIVAASDYLLEDNPPGTDTGDIVTVMRRSALAQAEHVNRLLAAALADTRGVSFSSESVPLEAVWSEVTATQHLPASQKGIKLTFTPTSAAVLGSAARIVQIINNLVSNAIKACPAGSEVTLTATREDDRVVIRVSDNGPGVEPGKLSDALRRPADQPPAAGELKLGLGLRMVSSLLHLHGSRLDMERPASGGMRFSFKLRPAN
ncbi:sensor histidine kinase [Actomonas aquatica]|uniref:histidine kinase n=1 Tax=Actomonas aquatica TaxID=2866162 RepID=A0ABZ1CCU9_9BACT|nr:HAMP domain-containing sensor histidine kinase [Opitutus sp. WL0086]WRQ89503.1 HAMP domain-containing sensor histidine kinase [Opitutus sp. WL0086]